MELTKILVCCFLVFIVLTEVVLCRPTRENKHTTDIEAIVKDIDNRLIHSEKKTSRRRRRHIQTQQIALMDFCVRYPARCMHEMQRMRNNSRTTIRFVYVIDK